MADDHGTNGSDVNGIKDKAIDMESVAILDAGSQYGKVWLSHEWHDVLLRSNFLFVEIR